MPFCQKCGAEAGTNASFCGSCGDSIALTTPAMSGGGQPRAAVLNGEVPGSWKKTFDLLEKAGGVKLPNVKNLPFNERLRLTFNVWGFLFGPIYYLAKGMWKKAIVLLTIGVLAIVILALVLEAMGIGMGITNFIIPAIFATRANIDHYKKMVLGDNGWW